MPIQYVEPIEGRESEMSAERGGVRVESGQQLLTVEEAASLANCSTKAIYAWSADRRIARIRLGRLVRFRRADIEAWIERNREPSVNG